VLFRSRSLLRSVLGVLVAVLVSFGPTPAVR
jgi:hypothetical protein